MVFHSPQADCLWGIFKIYEGILDVSNVVRDENDIFFQKIKKSSHFKKGIYIFRELTYRLIFKKVSSKYDYTKTRLSIEDIK